MLEISNLARNTLSSRKKVFIASLAILATSSYLKIDLSYIGVVLLLIIISLAFTKLLI